MRILHVTAEETSLSLRMAYLVVIYFYLFRDGNTLRAICHGIDTCIPFEKPWKSIPWKILHAGLGHQFPWTSIEISP